MIEQGNPRLQNYIIEECNGDIVKLENILNRKDEISLEHIFEDIWNSALSVIQPITKITCYVCRWMDKFFHQHGKD